MRLAVGLGAVSEARDAAEPLRDSMDEEAFDDLRIVLTELVGHCLREGIAAPISLFLLGRDDHVEARIVSASGPRRAPVAADHVPGDGGIGLRIIDRVSMGWGVEATAGQTILWARVAR